MKCWKCGNELPPGARFCGSCGAEQQAQTPPPGPEGQLPPVPQAPGPEAQTPPPPPPGESAWTPSGGNPGGPGVSGGPGAPGGGWAPNGGAGNENILKAFAVVCAVIYGVLAVRSLFGVLQTLVHIQYYFIVWWVLDLLFGGLTTVLFVLMAGVLVMTALRRTEQNADGLLVLLGIGGIGLVLVRLLDLIVTVIRSPYLFVSTIGGAFPIALGAVVVVGGVYAIRRYLLNENPLVGKTQEELQREVQEALNGLSRTAGEAASGAKASWDARQQAQTQAPPPPPPPPYNQQPPYGQPAPPPYGQPPYGQPAPPVGYAPYRLKTDRSLVAHILLSIITCGLYGWYFIYSIAKDVNVACAGDGKQTAGLLKFILLSIITCGIYSFIWYYSLGNRLAANAPRYGMNFQENGTTVLLWLLLGSWLCGIGAFIAIHIIIKNTNALCSAYNYQHGI